MFDSDIKNIHFLLELIEDVSECQRRHSDADEMLNDRVTRHAIHMCIMQIGETLKSSFSPEFLSKFGQSLPIGESYGTRNIIAHHYILVDRKIIKSLAQIHLPKLKETLLAILTELEKIM